MLRVRPRHGIPKNELLDIFYSGLTDESRTFLDSCAGGVFRKRTPDKAEELITKISQNYEDWVTAEPAPTPAPAPTPTPRKRVLLNLMMKE